MCLNSDIHVEKSIDTICYDLNTWVYMCMSFSLQEQFLLYILTPSDQTLYRSVGCCLIVV